MLMAMLDEYASARHLKVKSRKEKGCLADSFLPRKGDGAKAVAGKIVTIVLLLVIVVCGVVVGRELYERFEAQQNNERLINMRPGDDPLGRGDAVSAAAPSEGPNGGQAEERKPLVLLDTAAEYMEINGDYAGWVRIPGVFQEPVVQRGDNDYYLKINFYGQKRSVGTVFADYRNVVNDYDVSDNIILYGHNNKDGSMFGNMDYYVYDLKYWLKNPFVYFETRYERNVYVIIASFITNTQPEHDNGNIFNYQNYINFLPDGEYTFDNFIREINERTQFTTGIEATAEDKFLTLSTCQYLWEPSRHVIVARKLRPGETTENFDTTGFKINPNPKWPEIYYRYGGT
jgi:sortase B